MWWGAKTGIDLSHGARLGCVEDPRTASRAEGAKLGATRSGLSREGFHFALSEPKVRFVDDQGHAKRAAGLTLALGAMADNDLSGWSHHFITNIAALTAACIFGSHDVNPPGVWVPIGHESLFLTPVIIRPKVVICGHKVIVPWCH